MTYEDIQSCNQQSVEENSIQRIQNGNVIYCKDIVFDGSSGIVRHTSILIGGIYSLLFLIIYYMLNPNVHRDISVDRYRVFQNNFSHNVFSYFPFKSRSSTKHLKESPMRENNILSISTYPSNIDLQENKSFKYAYNAKRYYFANHNKHGITKIQFRDSIVIPDFIIEIPDKFLQSNNFEKNGNCNLIYKMNNYNYNSIPLMKVEDKLTSIMISKSL